MFVKRRFVFVLSVTAAMVISGCGFQLRGSGTQSDLPFRTMHVALPDTSSLGAHLRRNIGAGTTTIAAEPKAAEAVVEVLSEVQNKEVLSLNSQGRVRENALFYRVVFRVKNSKGTDFLPPTEIVLKRVMSFNESQVLAKEMEEASLYRDMQGDMARQILRRIAALKPSAP